MSTQFLTQVISGSIGFVAFPKINTRKILASGFVLISAILVFYIFQISEITKTASLVSGYEKEITILSQQNKDLEMNLSRGNSLTDLEIAINNFNYEKVGKVHYIQIMDSGMAVKR